MPLTYHRPHSSIDLLLPWYIVGNVGTEYRSTQWLQGLGLDAKNPCNREDGSAGWRLRARMLAHDDARGRLPFLLLPASARLFLVFVMFYSIRY